MKRILPAGESYGLFFAQPRQIKVQKNFFDFISKILFKKFNPLFFITVFLTFFLAHFTAEANAQKSKKTPKYYQIGDKVPKDFVLGYNPYDSTEIFTLNDFKGKAVIIDCWATWCGGCINGFPKMDSLYKSYESQLSILLINMQGGTPPRGDNPEIVKDFINKYKANNLNFSTQFLIEKKRIGESFSFRGIPHYIWIDRNRRVRAITNGESVTAQNIEDLLTGRPLYLPIKY